MNKPKTILIKGLIALKSIFMIFIALSSITIALELYTTRNQIEGRELIESTPAELISLVAVLFVLLMTLFLDIRTLKLKNETIYKKWIRVLLLTILVIAISIILKFQWLGIPLMLGVGFYALYLLSKYYGKFQELLLWP